MPWPDALARFRPPYRLRSVYEHLLGTEVEVQVAAATRAQAQKAEAAALDELERLTRLLNRFDPQSELRRWLARPGERVSLSPELCEVLALADGWRSLTDGAFHPGADALAELWRQAEREGREPETDALASAVQALQSPPWTRHEDGTATLHAPYTLGLNALAKGFIVDRAAQTAYRQPGVRAVLVNAGGDLRTLGGRGLTVVVADPFTARDDAPPVARVPVQDGALATSGQAHRGYRVGERWHSHVIDPRTGRPVTQTPGVTVLAPDCATADALATALSVIDPAEGLALVDARPGAAAMLVTADGRHRCSARWPLTGA